MTIINLFEWLLANYPRHYQIPNIEKADTPTNGTTIRWKMQWWQSMRAFSCYRAYYAKCIDGSQGWLRVDLSESSHEILIGH